MHETNCYLCGSAERRELFAQAGRDPYLALVDEKLLERRLSWYRCGQCNFVYRSPVLDPAELTVLYERYEKDIFRNTTPDAYFDRIIGFPPEQSENLQKAAWLKEQMSVRFADLAQLDVLDVGCGAGLLLHTLGRVFGTKKLSGVELNPEYAHLAERRSGARILQRAFVPGLFGRTFDLVMLTKVLEHVPHPAPFVQDLAKDLGPRGVLFLEVPDVLDLELLPPDHDRFYIPHIYYFSRAALAELVQRAGLAVLTARTVTGQRNRSYLQLLAARV